MWLSKIPIIRSSGKDLTDIDIALSEGCGDRYPLMLKALRGGGGKGMRVIGLR